MALKITKDYLRELYVIHQKSVSAISRESGWSRQAIAAALSRFGLTRELSGWLQVQRLFKEHNKKQEALLDIRIDEQAEEIKGLKKRIEENRLRGSLARIAEAQGQHYYFYWNNDEAVELANLHRNRKWCQALGIPYEEPDMAKALDAIAAEG